MSYLLCIEKSLFQVFICVIPKKLFTLHSFLRKNDFLAHELGLTDNINIIILQLCQTLNQR
jgi:hypothetical protein